MNACCHGRYQYLSGTFLQEGSCECLLSKAPIPSSSKGKREEERKKEVNNKLENFSGRFVARFYVPDNFSWVACNCSPGWYVLSHHCSSSHNSTVAYSDPSCTSSCQEYILQLQYAASQPLPGMPFMHPSCPGSLHMALKHEDEPWVHNLRIWHFPRSSSSFQSWLGEHTLAHEARHELLRLLGALHVIIAVGFSHCVMQVCTVDTPLGVHPARESLPVQLLQHSTCHCTCTLLSA